MEQVRERVKHRKRRSRKHIPDERVHGIQQADLRAMVEDSLGGLRWATRASRATWSVLAGFETTLFFTTFDSGRKRLISPFREWKRGTSTSQSPNTPRSDSRSRPHAAGMLTLFRYDIPRVARPDNYTTHGMHRREGCSL